MSYCPFTYLFRAFTPEDIEYSEEKVTKFNTDIKEVVVREIVDDLIHYYSENTFSSMFEGSEDEIIAKLDDYIYDNRSKVEAKLTEGLKKYLEVDKDSVYVNNWDPTYEVSVEASAECKLDLFALYTFLSGQTVTKKFELTDETIEEEGVTLHRIKNISTGKLGGFVETEDNLSQLGNCWVDDDAKVFKGAFVSDNALVCGHAKVWDHSKVSGDATVQGYSWVSFGSSVSGTAMILGNARIADKAIVSGGVTVVNTLIYNTRVIGNIKIETQHGEFWHSDFSGSVQIINCEKLEITSCKISEQVVFDGIKDFSMRDCVISGNFHLNQKIIDEIGVNRFERLKIPEMEIIPEPTAVKPIPEDVKVTQDFIFKIDEGSDKLSVRGEVGLKEFFERPVSQNELENALTIVAVDTKFPLMKIAKQEKDEKTVYKFIVNITTEKDENFSVSAIIETQEQLNKLIKQTVDALNSYPQFCKYADNLEECIK